MPSNMSGGSQHNPNGRQSQLGAGWSPLQLQVASFLSRAPQAHLSSERGLTWHTPTPPPHLYHPPAPSPPDPLQGLLQLQAMKAAGGNSVFRHTATPPELYRHTPTPPDKHLLRHTPSPGDVKGELYPHLGPGREKLRPEELLAYARAGGGVDLSVGARAAPTPATPTPTPALSVRDAPTINSLIARAQPRHPHARVDALLERLVPSPASPHSVIMHSRAAHTPSPPSSNEDSADSCGAAPGSKRKRKPERTVRVPAPGEAAPPRPAPAPPAAPAPRAPLENGDAHPRAAPSPCPDEKPATPTEPVHRTPEPPARRKSRSGSSETIDDIAAMIASTTAAAGPVAPVTEPESEPVVTVDKLESVLASPDAKREAEARTPPLEVKTEIEEVAVTPAVEAAPAAAPRRRSARTSNATNETANVPVESPSEAKPAEPDASEAPPTASFVEVENQLEKMFAGIEEPAADAPPSKPSKTKKRRKSAPAKGETKRARRASRASVGHERRRPGRGKRPAAAGAPPPAPAAGDAYDSGSNASSGRSRGPYIQIRGPRDSPLSVSVMNTAAAATAEDEESTVSRRGRGEFRNGLRVRGLHASTLGLRYDATTPDATWLCAFCQRGPHAPPVMGDLFGPYTVTTDCEEFRALDESSRRRYAAEGGCEVWFHESCGVWAPGLVAGGARVWGLAEAVWAARGARCGGCGRPGAGVACGARACRARTHAPCATPSGWRLDEDDFRALCPRHA